MSKAKFTIGDKVYRTKSASIFTIKGLESAVGTYLYNFGNSDFEFEGWLCEANQGNYELLQKLYPYFTFEKPSEEN